MFYLAKKQGLWCEGSGNRMQIINPTPIVLPLVVVGDENRRFQFREDYFNTVTRIRRGRVYQPGQVRRFQEFSFFPYPSSTNGADVDQLFSTATYKFSLNSKVILGSGNSTSRWTIVLEERADDDYYLTLKSQSYLGVLPEVDAEKLPKNQDKILSRLSVVSSSAPLDDPQPVIDACRNAAIILLLSKYDIQVKEKEKELANIVAKIEAGPCIKSVGTIINRLHTRTKESGQTGLGLRSPTQRDADLAVDGIAFLLQEFGWTVDPY